MENTTPENPKQEIEIGPLTGIIIIVLLLLAGAWYFLSQRVAKLEEQRKQSAELNATSTATSTETQ